MLLRFKDYTWILLNRVIDKGLQEGAIKHVEIPPNEMVMLLNEWRDLSPQEQENYLKDVTLYNGDSQCIRLDAYLTQDDFVDLWVSGVYRVEYRDILLMPQEVQETTAA